MQTIIISYDFNIYAKLNDFIYFFINNREIKMKSLIVISLFLLSFSNINCQIYKSDTPFAHTYSIVAYDPTNGDMGVAVQSHWFAVGTIVSWGEAGVGAIATQSFVNPSFGPRGLELLKLGKSAQQVLDELINSDEGREFRQLAIIDSKGTAASFTGSKCIQPAGNIVGKYFSVQANLMSNDKVWPAMKNTFENSKGELAERMLAALEAAEKEGGDIRGKQSAALLVVRGKSTGNLWEDRKIDLRIDDSENPLPEMRRLLNVHRAYQFMNEGDLAVEKDDMDEAMKQYSSAMKMFPDNLEMKYWTAVALANKGDLEKALPLFKEIFVKGNNWRELTPRLLPNGLLKVSPDVLKKILE